MTWPVPQHMTTRIFLVLRTTTCSILFHKYTNTIQVVAQVICLKPLTCGDRVNSVYLGQYHGCWCPGSLRRQDINSHDIDYIEYVGPSRIRGSILSTCVKSMWSNDIKCKYMFMFPLNNLARKGLIHQSRATFIWISNLGHNCFRW